jgi:hypothetical protein
VSPASPAASDSSLGLSGMGVGPDNCPICQNPVPEGQESTALVCEHSLHDPCVQSLLAAGDVRCPLCRVQFCCPVCKEEGEEGEELDHLSCNHELHSACKSALLANGIVHCPISGCNQRFAPYPQGIFFVFLLFVHGIHDSCLSVAPPATVIAPPVTVVAPVTQREGPPPLSSRVLATKRSVLCSSSSRGHLFR